MIDEITTFEVFVGHNPGTGEVKWREATNKEILDRTGRCWADMSEEERKHTEKLFK